MAEYIEREALMSKLDEKVKFYISDRTLQGNFTAGVLCDVRDETIAKFPSADVAPVLHGRWENNKDDYPECTMCGYMPVYDPALDDIYYSPYCPNCGAKMDGGGNG